MDGLVWGLCRIGGFVVEWAESVVVAVLAFGVVPGFGPVEDRRSELVTDRPVLLVEEFSLQSPKAGGNGDGFLSRKASV